MACVALSFPVCAQEEKMETTPEGYRYVLKLPANYQTNRLYSVLFCFHHQGDGLEAIRILGYANHKFDWILVGIMDLDYPDLDKINWKQVISAQESILEDVQRKYNVDSSRLFSSGFDTGAAMAFTMANAHPEQFRGVLALGGDFGLGEPAYAIGVYWCVGHQDPQLKTIRENYELLDEKHIHTTLHVFEGGRQWPQTKTINMGLRWINQF